MIKVITAHYPYDSKVVGLLDHSTNEVDWINEWIENHDILGSPILPRIFRATYFEGFGIPSWHGAIIYPVHQKRVAAIYHE